MNVDRQIILCRHAHADPGTDDRARALSVAGRQQAERCAAWLAEHPLRQSTLLYSPAKRAQETAEAIAASAQASARLQVDAIYEASVSDLLKVLEAHSGHLLLVGHNPGLESLLAFLCTGQSGSFRGMSPGSIALLHFSGPECAPGGAKLQAFFSP